MKSFAVRSAVLVVGISLFLSAGALPASAAGLKSTQIAAILSLLQSFGAATDTVSNISVALGGPALIASPVALSSGTLSASLDMATSPNFSQVAAGSTGVLLGSFKLSATNEAIDLRQVAFVLTSGSAHDLKSSTVTLWDASTGNQIGVAVFSSGTHATSSAIASGAFRVPANGSRTLFVRGDIAGVNISGPVTASGDILKLSLDAANTGISGTYAVGVSSGSTIKPTVAAAQSTAGTEILKSFPIITYNTQGGTLAAGTNTLLSFNIAADMHGDVALSKLSFLVTSKGASVSNVTFVGPNGSVGTVTQPNASGVVTVSFNSTSNVADSIVAAGTSKTYVLRATIGATSSNATIGVSLKGDTTLVTPSTAAQLSTANMVWSPLSTTVSPSATAKDWFNAYGLGGCFAQNGLGLDCAVDVYTIIPAQAPTASGTLSASLDMATSPNFSQVAAGSTGVLLGSFKLSATNEAIDLRQVALVLTSGSAKDLVNNTVTLWDASTSKPIATATFASGVHATSSVVAAGAFRVPTNGSRTFFVRGDIASIGIGGPIAASGDVLKVALDASNTGLGSAYAVGVMSGSNIQATTAAAKSTAGTEILKSFPIITYNTQGGTLAAGTNTLLSLNIAADMHGDVALSKLTFLIATTSAAISNVTFVGPNGAVGTVTPPNPSGVVTVMFNSANNTADSIVAAGTSKVYTLRATIGAATHAVVAVSLKGDALLVAPSTAAQLSTANMVWSPLSITANPTATTKDWLNSYGLGGCFAQNGLGLDCAVNVLSK